MIILLFQISVKVHILITGGFSAPIYIIMYKLVILTRFSCSACSDFLWSAGSSRNHNFLRSSWSTHRCLPWPLHNHHHDGIMVTSRESGSWVCPQNWGPTPVCQFVRPTLANEQSLTFPLCYIIQGLGTVFCENMVGKIGWVPISRSCGNSEICWSRTHQCSAREKGWK